MTEVATVLVGTLLHSSTAVEEGDPLKVLVSYGWSAADAARTSDLGPFPFLQLELSN